MLANTPVEFNYLETLAKTFIIPARQNQFIRENIYNNAPVRQNAISSNINYAFTGLYTENPFWYQQFDLSQIRILRCGQPIVYFDAADDCRLHITTMKARNFRNDITSIPSDNFKDHNVLKFHLTSIQDATENCLYREIVDEPLRLELIFTFLQNTSLNSLYWENECPQLHLTSLGLLIKVHENGYISVQQTTNRILHFKYRYRGSFPSDFVPTLDDDTSAILNMQGEHWTINANYRQLLYFADFLGREKYTFFKQQYERIMTEPLQPHPSLFGFYTLYAAFHPLKNQQEESTGVQDDNVFAFISNYK